MFWYKRLRFLFLSLFKCAKTKNDLIKHDEMKKLQGHHHSGDRVVRRSVIECDLLSLTWGFGESYMIVHCIISQPAIVS